MSGYGILLFIKLVSVIGLLLVAIHNRLVLTPALNSASPGAQTALRGSIHVEIILALMIVAFASSFRLTPPPRTAAQAPQAQIVAVSQANITAELQISPSLVGPNEIKIVVSKADGTSLEPIELTFGFSMPESDFGPIVVEASLDETGWRTQPFILPQPGEWTVDINLLVTDFDIVTLKTKVTVDP
jgi:copper transport protein